MRLLGFGAVSATALLLASCHTPGPPPPPPPPPGFVTCPDHEPGGGSTNNTSVADTIIPAPAGGSGLKIGAMAFSAANGVCIDSNGNINIYNNYTRSATFAITFAVPGQSLAWPSPDQAMQVAPSGGHYGPWPWGSGAPAVTGGTLSFTLPAEGPSHNYYYVLQYVDASGQHIVEPMIINH